jgi:putative membrane protein
MPYGHPFGHPLGAGHWLIQLILVALFVALIALAVVALVHYVRSTSGHETHSGGSSTEPPPAPEDVLRMRLARGEISSDEFRATMSTLAGSQ